MGAILFAVLIIAGVSVFSGAYKWLDALDASLKWSGVAVLMALFLGIVGKQINGCWLGVLINGRYKMSLSRLQITLWTILTLSAYLTIALPRIYGGLESTPCRLRFHKN